MDVLSDAPSPTPTTGEREGAYDLDRQDGRPADVPLQGRAGRRPGHVQVLRDERPRAQGRRLREWRGIRGRGEGQRR